MIRTDHKDEFIAICQISDKARIDFIYAQTKDAFDRIRTWNVKSGREELIGSWNERFCYTDEDIEAYLSFAESEGYRHIILLEDFQLTNNNILKFFIFQI